MSVTLAEKAPTSTLDPRFHIEAAERALNNILRGLSNCHR
jgi:hypothetical protein